ncbi:hypothetical protein [Mycolicibacterium komossense]|uniref:Ig-like domain-containing protein n=1 Tax=Mycolicibacterium komossense TaxID=1779 RepID=A0ABT3CIQ6_9MYCO|nr:hypothetical protein [Mycolicibacterium komossense]MCV7229096.1 hypothetical protein [Mycolicibacterium komossense]
MASVVVAIGLTSAAPAKAEVFITCPSGRDGVATVVTSCAFADNVRYAWLNQDGQVITAYSPVTSMFYTMYCDAGYTAHMDSGIVVDATRCEGGNDAVVVIW